MTACGAVSLCIAKRRVRAEKNQCITSYGSRCVHVMTLTDERVKLEANNLCTHRKICARNVL